MSDTQKLEDKETPFSVTSDSGLHDDVTRFLPDAQSVIQKALTSPLGCDEDSDHNCGEGSEWSEGSLEWDATSEKSQDDVIKEAVDTLKVYTLKIFFMSYHVFVRLSQKYP